MKPAIVIICGPTATGKTALAVNVAVACNGEVVNADSMQVYRDMDIGTAKPTAQEQNLARFHLIDVADPGETFSAGRFRREADQAIREIVARGKLPVLAGGTGLYLKALTQGIFEGPEADPVLREELFAEEEATPGFLYAKLLTIDPEKAGELARTDLGRIVRALEVYKLTGEPLSQLQNRHRFEESPYDALWIGLNLDRPLLYDRINRRAEQMIQEGWVDEVRALKQRGCFSGSAANALGYRTLLAHLNGKIELNEAIDRIRTETRKFAKRQCTWFNANSEIQWFDAQNKESEILELVRSWLQTRENAT
jgi:tRNA dimethylallyltransferase